MVPAPPLVLVVGPASSFPDETIDRLEERGFVVRSCPNGEEALRALAVAEPAVVLADVDLEDMDGHELERSCGDLFPEQPIPFVLLVGPLGPEAAAHLAAVGSCDYVVGPATSDEVADRVERAAAGVRAEVRRPSEPAPDSRSARLPTKVTGVSVGDHLVNVETEFDAAEGGQISTLVTVDGTPRRRTTSAPPPGLDPHEIERYMTAQHAAVAGGVRVRLEALLVQKRFRPEPTDEELERCLWLVRHACAKRQYAAARELVTGALAMFPSSAALQGYRQWLATKPDGA